MINIKELRIGNKVHCKISNDAGIYTVVSIPNWEMVDGQYFHQQKIVIDRCPRQVVEQKHLRPVKLTREFLIEKLDFVLDSDESYKGTYLTPLLDEHFKQRVRFSFNDEGACFYTMNMFGQVRIKGLHHMQNLLFDLYNYELPVDRL